MFFNRSVRKEVKQIYRNKDVLFLKDTNGSLALARWYHQDSVFSGWGTYSKPVQNFKAISFYVRSFDPNFLISEVRARVLLGDSTGTVLADKSANVVTEANVEKKITIEFDSIIANPGNSGLWVEFYTNGKTGVFSNSTSPSTPKVRYSSTGNTGNLTTIETSGGNPQRIMYVEFHGVNDEKETVVNPTFVSDLIGNSAFSDLFDAKYDLDYLPGSPEAAFYSNENSVFSGWGQFIGNPTNFDTIEIKPRWWKPDSPITRVRIIVSQNSHDGPVIFDDIKEFESPQLVGKIVNFRSNKLLNSAGANLYLMFLTDGKCGINYVASPPNGPVTKYVTNSNILSPNYLTPSGIISAFWHRLSKSGTKLASIGPTRRFIELIGLVNSVQVDAEILIPKTVRLAVGQEFNVYFEDLIKSNCNYDTINWNVISSIGRQYKNRWTFTPDSAGVFSATFEVYKDSRFLSSKTVSVDVKATSNGTGVTRKVLVIGDSITFSSFPTAKLISLFSSDPMDITLIGTVGSGGNLHEGVSGWKYEDHYLKPESSFTFSGSFDFAQYLSSNSFTMASGDYVVFNLGTNDMFPPTPDNREVSAKAALDYLDLMIQSIKSHNSGIKVLVCLSHASASQDAFGTNYDCGQTRRGYEENRRQLLSSTLERYEASAASGVYIVPLNLDSVNNYPTTSIQINSENVGTVTIQSNAVHPALSGYNQIGQCIYHAIKNLG